MAESVTEVSLEGGPHQPYHLVKPSPWPIVAALAGGSMAVGALIFLHGLSLGSLKIAQGVPWFLIAGFLFVLAVMFVWWRDVIHESVVERAHSAVVKIGLRYGMSLFIASEVMFFVAFFWAFFSSALYPNAGINGVWPPPGITPVDPFHFPFLMTMVLLLSGCTATWAHHALREGHNDEAKRALWCTIGLGIFFTMCQLYEYTHAEFGFRQGIFGSTFYMATGFHGFHVIVGTIFLSVCLWRVYTYLAGRPQFTPNSHFGFEAAAWYWHFVDVVWLFLFIAIYFWGGMPHGTPIQPASAAPAG
ncbi:MAG TPA: cytochrome c oxidase subunit 3 [Alphaproteobacteria bacterium]|nr:cytochrome c oxidase subunit 3 [Alphaproteobacteria bacterium]